MHISLKTLREHRPCRNGWVKLLRHLDQTETSDDPVSVITFLDACGLDDTLWSLRAVIGHEREVRLFGIWCARQVEHLSEGEYSKAALDVAEQYVNGLATEEELRLAAAKVQAAAWPTSGAKPIDQQDPAKAAAWAAWKAAEFIVADAASAAQNAAALAAGEQGGGPVWEATRAAQAAQLRKLAVDVEEAEWAALMPGEDESLDLP